MANFHYLRAGLLSGAVSVGLIAACVMGCGCTRKVYVPVEHSVRDTLLTTKLRIDTIQMHDSIYLVQHGDTVVKEIWHTRRYTKTRVDTVYKIRTDTVTRVVVEASRSESKSRDRRITSVIKWGAGVIILILAVCFRLHPRRN